MLCPCHSHSPYEECCQPYHQGTPAPTPVALMRSRFSAYALRNIDYIMETTHPSLQETHRPFPKWREEIAQFCDHTAFNGLEIIASEEHPEWGSVTFNAILSQGDQNISFTEKSRFEKQGGKWLYHSGEIVG